MHQEGEIFSQASKVWCIIGFAAITFSVVALRTSPLPAGPWANIYRELPLVWGLVSLAFVGLLMAARTDSVPNSVFAIGTFLAAAIPILIAHLWGYPFGIHDPWIHRWAVETIAVEGSSYPSAYSLLVVICQLTGISAETTISLIPGIALVIGIIATMAFGSRFSSRVGTQTVLVVSALGLSVGFTGRPFTFALPVVLVVFWLFMVDLRWEARSSLSAGTISTLQRRGHILLVIMGLAIVPLHTLSGVLVLFAAASVVIYTWFTPSYGKVSAIFYQGRGGMLFYLLGIFAVTYVFATTGTGARLVVGLAARFGGLELARSVAGASAITSAGAHLIEVVGRLSYPALLAVCAVVSCVIASRRWGRRMPPAAPVAVLTGAGVIALFIILAFTTPVGVSIGRALLIGPVVVIPGLFYVFERREGANEVLTIAVAVLLVAAGLGTAFGSPVTGSISYTATEPQVTGVEWMIGHRSDDVELVGTQMTYWLIEGKYGREVSRDLSPESVRGAAYTIRRPTQLSWEPPNDGNTVVVDRAERARARLTARESGNRTPLRTLRRFGTMNNRIYANGGTGIFRRESSV